MSWSSFILAAKLICGADDNLNFLPNGTYACFDLSLTEMEVVTTASPYDPDFYDADLNGCSTDTPDACDFPIRLED